MKIYNAEKTQILGDSKTLNGIDLTLGKLVADKLFIKTHEATEAVAAVSAEENAQKRREAGATVKEYGGKFYEVLTTFENGGEEVKEILPTEGVEAKPAWDEYEDIQVYIPCTTEELEARRIKAYEDLVESLIRQKYTISNELAILRQKDDKPEEFQEYYSYAEQCKATAKTEVLGK